MMIKAGIIGATGYAGGRAGTASAADIRMWRLSGTDPEAIWIRSMRSIYQNMFQIVERQVPG